ncbi:MAG: hypothetical protein HQL87_18545 [Magnetococcales bacterium]|nr:hypothetical protein [Magnetococcales bacterium]
MSLPIKNVVSHDGRLGERPSLATPVKGQVTETELSVAQDDFLGHFFSTPMMTQIRKRNQLLRDANDAVSLIQVADDALDTTTTALVRMRKLSAPNQPDAPQDAVERLTEQLEITEDIWTIAQKTLFNDQPLLNGHINQKVYVVGEGADNLIPITINNMGSMALALQRRIGAVVSTEAAIGTQAVSEAKLELIEQMLSAVVRERANLDALQTRFVQAIANLEHIMEETMLAREQVSDAGVAMEIATIARDTLCHHAEESVPIQANQQPPITMRLLQ